MSRLVLRILATIHPLNSSIQVTTEQADAADEDAIVAVCKQAIQEEGRLDVFFANVRSSELVSAEAGPQDLCRRLELLPQHPCGISLRNSFLKSCVSTRCRQF